MSRVVHDVVDFEYGVPYIIFLIYEYKVMLIGKSFNSGGGGGVNFYQNCSIFHLILFNQTFSKI